jgi:hypothetical protein
MLIRSRDQSRLHRRQCVACGYSGRFVDRPGQTACPRCECDFTERPPRSYAEMEGLDELPKAERRDRRRDRGEPIEREWRLVERWLAFLFGVTLVGIAVVALGFAAFVVR